MWGSDVTAFLKTTKVLLFYFDKKVLCKDFKKIKHTSYNKVPHNDPK